ncbi:hypothetical protein PIIN_00508 [Serendipita indica DSM 11827]|uniref:Uncharacterized protein n=2 Tax=cellular organisms TaxID=131567 RepID=G4U2P0_SERID|nr:hypothetical protein PIIN_00508 [Serendipita indica DSM 11827]
MSAPAPASSASSVGHGQPNGSQLYPTANGFPAPASQWTPSPNAAPFYPQFTPFFHPATPPVAPQPQYFDPNQQIAWAYQQMMLQQAAIAQQHHQNQFMAELGRARANSNPQQNDFFPAQSQVPMIPGFPFQSGTPPAHPGYNGSPQSFRRGPQGHHHMPGPRSNTFDSHDWSRMTPQGFSAPYARPDAAGSSHSVNSSNGSGSGPRQRTLSNNTNSSQNQTPPGSMRGPNNRGATVPQLTTDFERPRQPQSRQNSAGPPSPATQARPLHQRNVSGSSDRTIGSARAQTNGSPTTSSANAASASSAAPSSSPSSSPTNSQMARPNQRAPPKPSPLSQQQTFSDTASLSKRAKRLSKDDSELLPQTTVASALTPRQSGLKGRFKRALAFQPPSSVDEHGDGISSIGHSDMGSTVGHSAAGDGEVTPVTTGTAGESVRSTKPKSRAAALFSGKFNASTDNISLSSTVSSASVMIRKLGSIGKLARRNSLMSISSIFKDKNKDKGEGGSGLGKKNKKGDMAEPTVSHATAENDRGGGSEDESLVGLTPAARVARQHTLKTKAEAAKRLREQAAAASSSAATSTAAAATASSAAAPTVANGAGVPSWDKSTTTRRGENSSRGVSEDGTVIDERSDDGSGEGGYDPQFDPNATLRMPGGPDAEEEELDEPWAVGLRRSIEKTRQPGKSVLKNATNYVQENYLDPPNQPFAARIRSNSYQTVSESTPGPLAHLPPPNPDHIDGLQRGNSTSNTPEKKPFSLPAFSFEFGDSIDIVPKDETQETLPSSPNVLANSADKGPTFAYTHPTANSSAPVLSMATSNSVPATTLSTVKKSISFAATLSIYDTFSSTTYDRRSEPSTANRLTPALAQRIKEELNSFKMEEMEVHSASRIHTHFFV